MLSAANRLKKNEDFKKVALNGRRNYSTFFVVYRLVGETKKARVGIVVSNKVSKKAVVRNKLRRWLSNDLKEMIDKLTPADYMIVVKPSCEKAKHETLKKDLLNIAGKLKDRK